jgi:uncharacterized protein (UPF0332 family)
MRAALGDEFSTVIGYFDRMRVKRNQAMCDVAGLITENEAKAILAHATQFVEAIRSQLQATLD